MADPLSFTASVIAITTLTVHISRLIRNTSHASDEILALGDELEGLRALAKLPQSLCRQSWPRCQRTNIIEAKRILDNVVVKRLRKIQGYLDKLGRSKIKATKNIRYVIMPRKINMEREGLRGAKQHLFDIVCVLNASTTRRVSLQAKNLSRDIAQIQDTQAQNYQEVVARLDQYLGPVQSIQAEDYRNILARFDGHFGLVHGTDIQSHQNIFTRLNLYFRCIQSIHVQEYQRILSRLEQYLGPTEDGQIHSYQDIATRFDGFLDRIRSREILLEQWSLDLEPALHPLQVAIDDMIAEFAREDDDEDDDDKQPSCMKSRESTVVDYSHTSAALKNLSPGQDRVYQGIDDRESQCAPALPTVRSAVIFDYLCYSTLYFYSKYVQIVRKLSDVLSYTRHSRVRGECSTNYPVLGLSTEGGGS